MKLLNAPVDKDAKEPKATKEAKDVKETKIAKTVAKDAAKSTPKDSKENKEVKESTKGKVKTRKGLKLPKLRKIHVKPSYVVLGVFLVLFVTFFARVAIWEHNYIAAMEGSERDIVESTGGVYDGGEEEVDDTQPTETEVAVYTVAPDKPRYFRVPSLGINAIVVEVGRKENREMATPTNIYHVGWYTGSSLPGTNGVTILDGHGGDGGWGIFRTLPRIQIGAEIKVEMGDGRQYTYRVVETATKELGDDANNYMQEYAFSSPEPGVGSMTLITCTGDWWEASQTYSQRFFLRALLVE